MAEKAWAIRMVVHCVVTGVEDPAVAINEAAGCIDALDGTVLSSGGYLTIQGELEAEAAETEVG